MVVDTLENLEKYASLNPLFAQAIEFLKSHDLQAMEVGKTELKGKDLWNCHTQFCTQVEEMINSMTRSKNNGSMIQDRNFLLSELFR